MEIVLIFVAWYFFHHFVAIVETIDRFQATILFAASKVFPWMLRDRPLFSSVCVCVCGGGGGGGVSWFPGGRKIFLRRLSAYKFFSSTRCADSSFLNSPNFTMTWPLQTIFPRCTSGADNLFQQFFSCRQFFSQSWYPSWEENNGQSLTLSGLRSSEAQMTKLTAAYQKRLTLWCPNFVTFCYFLSSRHVIFLKLNPFSGW